MASAKDMDLLLLKHRWKKVPGGWENKDKDEFGVAVYTTAHAYRLQVEINSKKPKHKLYGGE
jgi:hypothetical protein